jgi:hypothetical protein
MDHGKTPSVPLVDRDIEDPPKNADKLGLRDRRQLEVQPAQRAPRLELDWLS